jgi:hypothetical protein
VVNAGLITAGYTHTAVALADGGSVTNQSGGTIIGTQHLAIYMTGALAGTVVNDGSIISLGTTTGASGIVFQAGGYVSNASGGFIRSANRIAVDATSGSLIVMNAGSIAGGKAHSAIYHTGGNSTVDNSGRVTGGAYLSDPLISNDRKEPTERAELRRRGTAGARCVAGSSGAWRGNPTVRTGAGSRATRHRSGGGVAH